LTEADADRRKTLTPRTGGSGGSLVALLVFAFASALLYARHENAEAVAGTSPLIGSPAPPLAAPGLGGSTPLTDADLRGHFTLVNFFASWCGPCRAEHGVLMELARDPRLKGKAVMVGVAFKDRARDVAAFLARRGDPFAKIGADPWGTLAARWDVRGIPHSFVVDASGHVVDDFLGPMGPKARARLEKRLTAPGGDEAAGRERDSRKQ
jgi:cytochrome c biogenesis protein CcmG, thiol:disulfide interchange protein DsbE